MAATLVQPYFFMNAMIPSTAAVSGEILLRKVGYIAVLDKEGLVAPADIYISEISVRYQ